MENAFQNTCEAIRNQLILILYSYKITYSQAVVGVCNELFGFCIYLLANTEQTRYTHLAIQCMATCLQVIGEIS